MNDRSSPTDIAEFNYIMDAFCAEKKPLLPSSIVRDGQFLDAMQKFFGGGVDPRFFHYIKSEYASHDDAWKNIHGYRHPNRNHLLNAMFSFAEMYYKTEFQRPEWLHAEFKPIR